MSEKEQTIIPDLNLFKTPDSPKITILDWDEVFKNPINVDSFVGWKIRKGREYEKLSELLKPIFEAINNSVESVGYTESETDQ